MFKRFAASIAAGVLVVTGLAAGTAHADPVLTDTIRVTNYLDNGAGGYWAWRNFSRTTTITKVEEGDGQEGDTYLVRVVDRRDHLRTIKGAKSPKDAVPIARSVRGVATGWYESRVTSTSKPANVDAPPVVNANCGFFGDGKAPRQDDCPGLKYETHDWWKWYFKDGAVVPGSESYRWDYRADCERWTDPNGTTDITGKRCVRPGTPTAADPACDTQHGTLTIPAQRGVRYEMRRGSNPYRAVRAGEHQVRPGVYWVRAVARDGYRLVGRDGWRLVVARAEACPTPTPTGDATDEPTVSPSPTVEPSQPSTPPAEEPTPSETSVPVPTVTETVTQRTVVERYLPTRVDTGLGGTAK